MMFALSEMLSAFSRSLAGGDGQISAPRRGALLESIVSDEFASVLNGQSAETFAWDSRDDVEVAAATGNPATTIGDTLSSAPVILQRGMLFGAPPAPKEACEKGIACEAPEVAAVSIATGADVLSQWVEPAAPVQRAAPSAEPPWEPRMAFEPALTQIDAPTITTPRAPGAAADLSLPALVNFSSEQHVSTEAPIALHVTSLETHLPSALAHEAMKLAPADGEGVSLAARDFDPRALNPREAAAVKILTFELEPATLGALVVKMRMAQTHVEIEIEAQSSAALSHLHELREKMTTAVGATGCVVDALEIRIAPSLSLDMGQAQANDGKGSFSQGSSSQKQEFQNDDRGGGRNHPQPQRQARAVQHGDNRSGGDAGGVYL